MRKTLLYIIICALSWLFTMPGLQAQELENHLSVIRFEGSVNRTVSIPVYLDNDQEVVAAQFDITLPFRVPKDEVPTLVSRRANMHSVNMTLLRDNTYRVVVMSMQNNALRGNSGLLLRIPMQVEEDGQTSYIISLNNIVLTDRQGNNIATETEATGEFALSKENRPDLKVDNIRPLTTQAAPGDTLSLGYQVVNIGTASTGGGWTEKIYLESVATGVQTYIGTQTYQQGIGKQELALREASVVLPRLLHADGAMRVFIQVEPMASTGELLADQGNNSGYSAATVTLSKRLYLTSDRTSIAEGGTAATMTLSRSGDWSRAETFQLTSSVPGLFARNGTTLPCNVTIPAGSTGVSFRLSAVDDAIVRARQAHIEVETAHGYEAVGMDVARTDNDRNPLTLKLSASEMTEGETLKLAFTRGGELTDTLRFTVTCSDPLRFSSPISVTMLPGNSTATVEVEAIHDGVPELDGNVRFTAAATDYATASASVKLLDPDRPQLMLMLSPSIVPENVGMLTATVRLDRSMEQDAVIRLNSNRSDISFDNSQVRIPAGDDHADVTVRLKDNTKVDGTRTCQLTAALYIEMQQKEAPSGDRAYTQATLTVTDDESPYLTLSSLTSSVAEGSSTSMTLHRYVPSTTSSLTVTLTASDASLTVPSTVTIPAGRTETTFTVQAQRNSTEGDDRQAVVRATASGMEPAEASLRVTDRTLPDATCPAVGGETNEFYAGMPATIWAEVHNDGTATLPAGMTIDFYLATSSTLGRYVTSTLMTSVATPEALTPGQTKRWSFQATVPQGVGNRWLYARLNADAAIGEFSTTNNLSSPFAPVYVAAPFSVVTVQADKESYLPGETATITGQVQGQLAGQTVRVTLDGAGQNSYADTQIDAQGYFTAYVRIDRSARGMLTVQARALGQTEAAKTTQVNVYNLSLRTSQSRLSLHENYPYTGTLTLTNTSGKDITGINLSQSSLPYGCLMELGAASGNLKAGASVEIPFTIQPTQSMTGNNYEPITVTASCAEGVSSEVTMYYYCHSTSGNLVFAENTVNTTVLLGSSRTYDIKVTNRGLKATGPIMLTVPDDVPWLSSLTPASLPSLAPGASTTLTFKLTHQQGMHSGEQFGTSVLLVPESGAARGLGINVRVVGTEYSKLDVYATDVYSKGKGDFSKVSMAQVSVTEARTGRHVMTGVTDGAGHWMTTQMTQGVYNVEISALRHRTVRQQLVIGPGEDKSMTLYLPYQAVVTDFVVEQEDNNYYMTSYIDVDRQAPQAIVLPTLAEAGFECGTDTVDIVMTNVGSYPALNPLMVMPEVQGTSFTWLNDFPATLHPQETHVARLRYEGPEEGRRRMIASLQMRYAFPLQGENYMETDLYQSLVGCSRENPKPPVVLPPSPVPGPDDDPVQPSWDPTDEDPGSGGTNTDQGGGNHGQAQGTGTKKALPTLNSSFELLLTNTDQVLTGQPLKAQLKVVNGQAKALTSLRFSTVTEDFDDPDRDVSSCFTVHEGGMTGFVSDGRYLTLEGNSEGTMDLELVPTEEAAKDGSRQYLVGGQLGYRQGNIYTSATLAPVMITVSPMGEVHLTYLIQRQFMADDPQTEQVETAEPAQFTLLAQNRGTIPVDVLHVSTEQPELMADADEMPVKYSSLYTTLNGQENNLMFADVQLDSLTGGTNAVARWFYQSELQAHVASVEQVAQAAQAMVGSATRVVVEGAMELVRAVATEEPREQQSADVDAKLLALADADAYLLNLVEDEENRPDRVMTADGETHELEDVSATAVMTGASGTYQLRVQPSKAGWTYGRLPDPTAGMLRLESVKRMGNGRMVSLANFWQTDRSILADHTSVSETMIHFADSVEAGGETFELHFAPRPGEPVQVMSVKLFDANGQEIAAGDTTETPVTRAQVEFTQPIVRLYNSSYMLSARGMMQDQNLVPVQQDEHTGSWILDLSELPAVPGRHELKLLGAKVKDRQQRQPGQGTWTVAWTEQLAGTATMDIQVDPDTTWGSTDRQTGSYPYGVLQIKATPAEGYQFGRWTENGAMLTTDSVLNYDVWQDATLRAVFFRRTCQIMVECADSLGRLNGNVTGVYPWGEELVLTAIPFAGFKFHEWTCNGVTVATTPTIHVKAQQDAVYKAHFLQEGAVGVSTATKPSRPMNIYSLTGTLLRSHVTDVKAALRSLPRGIYIVGGRKVCNR